MDSMKAAGRRAGFLYILFAIAGIIEMFGFPDFLVSGDAAATARNISAGESIYRLSILVSLVTLVLFLLVVLSLYKLFQDVDRPKARLMVLFVVAGTGVAFANQLIKSAPLVLLNGADYWAPFTKPQLEALVLGFLGFHVYGVRIAMAFWGLWLLPFGVLVFRSSFIPKTLGVLLWVAGVAYLLTSLTAIGLPAYRSLVSKLMFPLYLGEVPIIFWLAIQGAREQKAVAG